MKKIILFTFCIVSYAVYAQVEETKTTIESAEKELTENQKRIVEIPNRIEEAVAAKNYQEAANLKEELELRKSIENALTHKNYQEAANLKEQLANCECRPKPEKECEDDVAAKATEVKKERSYGPKRFSFYMDFYPVGYGNIAYDSYRYYGSYSNGTQTSYIPIEEPMQIRESVSNLLGGLRIGSSIFFGDLDKKFKVGLDISYLSVTAGISPDGSGFGPSGFISLARPGIIMTKFFNKKNGLDMKVHAGPLVGGGNFSGGLGLNGAAQVKYWKKRFAVGLEYQYGHIFDGNTNINLIGVTLGFRL